jgi:hypothetical protein
MKIRGIQFQMSMELIRQLHNAAFPHPDDAGGTAAVQADLYLRLSDACRPALPPPGITIQRIMPCA